MGFFLISGAGGQSFGGGSEGTVIFGPDDFSSYSTTESAAATVTELVTTGPYDLLETELGTCRIEVWPLNGSLQCYSMEYTEDETTDKLHVVMPADMTHGKFEWDEVRSTGFDFSNTKDARFPLFAEDNPGDTVDVDIYNSFVDETKTAGVDDSTHAGMFGQGASIAPGLDYIAYGAFDFQRDTEYHVTVEIKANTPGSADGIVSLTMLNKSTMGSDTFEDRAVKLSSDSTAQCVIRRMQWGMAATTGGSGFAGTSKIYRRNLQVTRFA